MEAECWSEDEPGTTADTSVEPSTKGRGRTGIQILEPEVPDSQVLGHMLQHRRCSKKDMGATDVRQGVPHHVLPGARPKKAVVRTKVTQRNRSINTFVDILGPRPPAPSTPSPWGKGAHGLEKRLRQPRDSARAQELPSCIMLS